MMKNIKSLLFIIGALLISYESVQAVRISDDDWRPARSVETQEALEKQLFDKVTPPLIHAGRVSFTLERERQQSKENDASLERADLIAAAVETQLGELLLQAPEDLRELLQKRWASNDWVSFSKRGEHSLASRPLGEMAVYTRNEFRLYLDDRLKDLPTLQKIIKMIAITHVVLPRLLILESEGTAFYQRTHEVLETVTLGTGFWTLTQWLQLVQVEKVISAEVRTSRLQLMDIRGMLAEIREIHSGEAVQQLNRYIKTHHRAAITNSRLKAFFQSWLNQAAASASASGVIAKNEMNKSETKEAKIIPFKPRAKVIDGATCARALTLEESP